MMNSNSKAEQDKIDQQIKVDHIDGVSPSFCLAKWLQCTLDLHNGTTHSCHHPDRHQIPIDELQQSPAALHNTQFKMQQRNKMLEGIRPKECEYCWKIEDLKGNHLSDRYIKSSDPWAYPSLEKIAAMPWDQPVAPTYLEVMFDNVCNLSCSYCMSDVSSTINNEMKKYGAYQVSDPAHRMPRKRDNPKLDPEVYRDAFWKWLPDIIKDLQFLRITGGEPFLSPNVDKLLDYLKNDPQGNKHLILAINSNLIIEDSRLHSYIDKLNDLISNKKIKNVEFYTSLEAKGPAAEYIRPGLTYSKFLQNLDFVANRLPNSTIVIMSTFNILALSSFKDFAKDILELKGKYPQIILDISYLKDPSYLCADFITKNEYYLLDEILIFLNENKSTNHKGFTQYEINKFLRVYDWIKSDKNKDHLVQQRSDFYNFIKEFDKRKGFDFSHTFPALASFFQLCKKAQAFVSLKF